MIGRYKPFRVSAPYDVTGGRVHLDLCWIDEHRLLQGRLVDCSIQHTSRGTRPLVMSEEADFLNGLLRLILLTPGGAIGDL